MDLLGRYLEKQINRFRLWITDQHNEVSQINEEFCELMDFRPDLVYSGGKFRVKIRIANWVFENMNSGDTEGWQKRLSVMIIDDGYQEENPFRILSGQITPDPQGDYIEYHALVEHFTE